MKKTLLVTLDFYPNIGGIAHYWAHLGGCMSPAAWVVLAPPLPKGVVECDSHYTLYRKPLISKKLFPRWLELLIHTWHISRKEKIEILIAAQILPVGTICWILHMLLKIPYVVSTHGMDIMMPLKNPWKRFLSQCILQGAEKIIANSTFTAYYLSTYGISEKSIEIIYPCPTVAGSKLIQPSEMVGSILSRCEGKKVLLTVGRLVKRKGHEYVIQALKDVQKIIPDIIYLIVGGGRTHNELKQLVSSLDLNGVVMFTGLLSDNDVTTLMKRCDMFIMTPVDLDGDVEGFGIVYLEAGLHGKPVIASRTGGVGEAVIDGVTGLLVDEKNSDQIRDAIVRLSTDELLAKKLGEQGRGRVLKEFNIEEQVKKLRTILT